MENFDPTKPAEGFGDIIAKITHKLGIAQIAQEVAHLVGKEDCGCNERREALNELFPFNKNKQEENAERTTDPE